MIFCEKQHLGESCRGSLVPANELACAKSSICDESGSQDWHTLQLKPLRRTRTAKGGFGFTLIEVMVTVAIVAILASIALPSYNEYIIRGRIQEGLTPLGDMQAKLEQYFQDQRTYVGACDPANSNTIAPKPVDTPRFAFNCPIATANAYEVDATGLADLAGFTYRLTLAAGVVTKSTVSVKSGWNLPPGNCWTIRKDGSC